MMAQTSLDPEIIDAETGSSSDSDFWDSDGGSLMTDTTSLRSYIQKHSFENGRRYNAQGDYVYPNDEEEQKRLDLTHQLFTTILDEQLFAADIGSNPDRILDIGTGTGIWAIDVADKFPSAHVVGTDMSPIQPEWVPPNCEFHIDDANADWTFPQNSYDLIHVRYMRFAITDWNKLFTQSLQTLKPGGYLEVSEPEIEIYCDDGTLPEDSYMYRYRKLIFEASAKIGKPLEDEPRKVKGAMEAAGFTDVEVMVKKVPLGVWPKDKKMKTIGGYQLLILLDGIDGICLRLFSKVLGWRVEEVQVFCAKLKSEMRNRKYHIHFKYYFTTGRKPQAKPQA